MPGYGDFRRSSERLEQIKRGVKMKIHKVVKTSYISDEGFSFTFEPVMDEVDIKKTKSGYEARYLAQDNNDEGPEMDDALFLVGYHRDFTVTRDDILKKDQCVNLFEDPKNLEDYDKEWVIDFKKRYWIFGLEAYIHSGVVLALSHEGNFPDRCWDVSQLGAVLVSKKEWKTEKKARAAALSLIKIINQSNSGEVYGVVLETFDKNKDQIDHNAVWGFYGYDYAKNRIKTFTV
jgi:hypothetical protein